jgi:hypothetical protein
MIKEKKSPLEPQVKAEAPPAVTVPEEVDGNALA